MKKEKLLSTFILPIMWIIYFLFELFTGRVNNIDTIVGNVILTILFGLFGYYIYHIKLKYPHGISNTKVFLFMLLSFALDQGIKIIIKLFFFNNTITIIKDFLYFNPIINTDGSWLNARFNTGINFSILIIFNILALFIFIELYRYILFKNKKTFWIDLCFIFIFCGALCSLVDKLFYGGSLDFIGIGDLFIADIKDIYINLGLLFFILSIYTGGYFNSNEDTTLKEDFRSLMKFLSFIKNDILSFFIK